MSYAVHAIGKVIAWVVYVPRAEDAKDLVRADSAIGSITSDIIETSSSLTRFRGISWLEISRDGGDSGRICRRPVENGTVWQDVSREQQLPLQTPLIAATGGGERAE